MRASWFLLTFFWNDWIVLFIEAMSTAATCSTSSPAQQKEQLGPISMILFQWFFPIRVLYRLIKNRTTFSKGRDTD